MRIRVPPCGRTACHYERFRLNLVIEGTDHELKQKLETDISRHARHASSVVQRVAVDDRNQLKAQVVNPELKLPTSSDLVL